jgi:hypothetical protein
VHVAIGRDGIRRMFYLRDNIFPDEPTDRVSFPANGLLPFGAQLTPCDDDGAGRGGEQAAAAEGVTSGNALVAIVQDGASLIREPWAQPPAALRG